MSKHQKLCEKNSPSRRKESPPIISNGHGSVNLTGGKNITNSTNDPFSWIERYDVLLIWIIIALLIFILSLYGLLP